MIIDEKYLDSIEIIPLMDTLRLQKIDDAEYFSEKFSGYISNSRLSLLNPYQDNDPKAFFEGLGKHNKYSDALIFGSAVHELVLQPELFELAFDVNRPTAKMGFMADELYRPYIRGELNKGRIIEASDKIDYYKGKMTDERIEAVINTCQPYWESREVNEKGLLDPTISQIYLDSKNRERVLQCVEALKRNKSIQKLLHPKGIVVDPISENEQAILLDVQVKVPEYEPFIFRIKAKLDNYTIDTESNVVVVNDVKTIGKILSEFGNNFEKFHYHRELSLYSWLMTLVADKFYGMKNCSVQSNCLVVSTIPDYYTKVYKLSKADFNKGWNEFKFLLRLAAYYYSKGYRFD